MPRRAVATSTAFVAIIVLLVGALGGVSFSQGTLAGNDEAAIPPAPAVSNQATLPPAPSGMPPFVSLNSTGDLLAKLAEQTPPFEALADGMPYSIRPYQSFGYEWGATIPSEEIITFFSPNGLLTIQVYAITAPAPGTTSVNQSQIAYARPDTRGNSTSGESLLLDLPLNLNGTSIAPSFTPIIVFMSYSNNTEFAQFHFG